MTVSAVLKDCNPDHGLLRFILHNPRSAQSINAWWSISGWFTRAYNPPHFTFHFNPRCTPVLRSTPATFHDSGPFNLQTSKLHYGLWSLKSMFNFSERSRPVYSSTLFRAVIHLGSQSHPQSTTVKSTPVNSLFQSMVHIPWFIPVHFNIRCTKVYSPLLSAVHYPLQTLVPSSPLVHSSLLFMVHGSLQFTVQSTVHFSTLSMVHSCQLSISI